MKRLQAAVLALLLSAPVLAADAPPPKFSTKPSATKVADDKVKIEFAADRECDVAVFIENGNGKVIRHLVAGVLGKNPPPPLKPGLAQSVEWDGKADWGKPAPAGPFKVRVALGLGAKYDKVVLSEPQNIGQSTVALAAAKDGTLYAITSSSPTYAFGGQSIVALDRDGNYQRTVIPPPSSASKEQLSAMAVTAEVGGRSVPVVQSFPGHQLTSFRADAEGDMAVTSEGQLLVLDPYARIDLIDTSGTGKPLPLAGPGLMPSTPAASFATYGERRFLTVSSDSRHAFFNGLAKKRSYSSAKVPPWSAIYRVKLPERSPAEPFFGDPEKSGNDESHLGASIGGLATDGKGTLLICDTKNNRVVAVSEADGKFVGSIPVESPVLVAVDGKTGAVYVLRVMPKAQGELVKFSGWRDARQLATTRQNPVREESVMHMALDASASPPVIWLADNRRGLLRIEDLGGKFSDARGVNTGNLGNMGFVNLTVDHWREDPEVYVRSGMGGYWWTRFNEKSGAVDHLKNLNFLSDAAGACVEVGPEGNLYTQAWPIFLAKWDHSGKPLKWDVPFKLPEGLTMQSGYKGYIDKPMPNAIFMPVCMVFMTHTLGVRSDGHIFAFERKPSARERGSRKALFEYEPSGRRLPTPVIWNVSDAVVGPRFDQQGNIYLAEQVRPVDQLAPPEFLPVTGPVTPKSMFAQWEQVDARAVPAWYGSILKFSPKGGLVKHLPGHYAIDGPATQLAYDGEPKLDPSLKTVDAGCFAAGTSEFKYAGVKVTGAEWMHFGISPMFLGGCNCESTRFDVDPFGRVWCPDLGRYRVQVLDTNGNLITCFGGYGNAESCGPDSPVVDPQTKKLRPRKTDDPNDLKSPFAEPDIAFSWLIGVGATDKYAYMGDSMNRRLLRAKLVYAAEESCEVKGGEVQP